MVMLKQDVTEKQGDHEKIFLWLSAKKKKRVKY
jgi:hypothetical protein